MTKGRIFILVALLGVVLWFVFTGGEADYPITNATPTGANIIAFGDSLTAGYGAQPDEAYPAVLARRFGVPIVNAGITGDTTGGALQRLDRDVLTRDPRIVLVCLGGNDALRKTPVDETFSNLRTIVERIQQRGALVVLIGLEIPMQPYGPRYNQLAVETGCAFVPDLLDGILARTELMSDSVHPNAAGYKKMADKIEPVLRPYVVTMQER